jgi:hypothetical protein
VARCHSSSGFRESNSISLAMFVATISELADMGMSHSAEKLV